MAAPGGDDRLGSDDLRRENERLRAVLSREQEKLRALQEIGVALGSTLDMNELLSLVLDRISKVMDADRSTLYLLDEERGEVWSKVAQGEQIVEIRLKIGEGLAGWVAKSGRVLNIADAYQDVRFEAEWDRRTGYRTRSILAVPMKNQHGRTIGVVQVLNKRDGAFTGEDESLLSALASQAAVSIENSKLFLNVVNKNMELLETKEQLERKIRELDVLFEIAHVSASAMRLEELLEGVLARAMRAIDAEAGSILIGDERTGDLRFRCAVGGVPEEVKRVRIKAGQGICGWVAANQRPQIVNDVDADARHSRSISDRVGYHPRSVMAVPLQWDTAGVGALELLNKGQGKEDFNADDLKLATMIAGHISTAIGLARSRERRERSERLSTIGQLLSGVLHDLKTPMTVISGYVQLLVKENVQDERRKYAETILGQVELINAMTRETLAFARGDTQVWVRKVYLHKFFEDVGNQLKRELEHKPGVELALDVRDRGIARFDQHKIQRAIHNLVRNAAEAIADRGGTITVGVERRPESSAEPGAIVLTISDTGPGLPDEMRERLFESFTTHGKPHGTGLGLAIVRKIVDDHGGTIEFSSQPGHTVFTIVLPQIGLDTQTERPPPPEDGTGIIPDPGRPSWIG